MRWPRGDESAMMAMRTKVEPVPHKVHLRVAEMQVDCDLRQAGEQLRQQRRQVGDAEGHRGRDARQAARLGGS